MKTINLNQRNVIEPIEWTQYNGEEVIVKTIIKGGKKIQEKQFYEDKVKAVSYTHLTLPTILLV